METTMRKQTKRFLLLILALTFLLGCSTNQSAIMNNPEVLTAAPQKAQEYIIQPGDQLDIKFFYNPELNEAITVRPDGMISLQLVDEVRAAGLEPAQLDRILSEKYSKELQKPAVTVIVRSFTSQRVYVGGEVNVQGLVELTPGLTPLKAVLNAGGFKETALQDGVILIRKGPDDYPIPIRVDLKDALYGNNPDAEIPLQPQDVVYVPKTWIAKANKFVNQYIENLLLYRGVGVGFTYQVNRFPE